MVGVRKREDARDGECEEERKREGVREREGVRDGECEEERG